MSMVPGMYTFVERYQWYTLNISHLLYISYTSIKLLLKNEMWTLPIFQCLTLSQVQQWTEKYRWCCPVIWAMNFM